MSALLAMPSILPEAAAVADAGFPASGFPVGRPRPLGGLAFYRRFTLTLLTRYLHTSMELGRAPCILGLAVMRGKVSSRRRGTLEDMLIFVLDIEKGLSTLDRVSQTVIAHVALEDYTPAQTADIMRESERTIHRIYAAAMDRLTRIFLGNGLLDPSESDVSRGRREIQSNDSTKQTSYISLSRKKVGSV